LQPIRARGEDACNHEQREVCCDVSDERNYRIDYPEFGRSEVWPLDSRIALSYSVMQPFVTGILVVWG
jgi:hypothetical protein